MDIKALYKLSYGMFIVCSKKGDKVNGQVANTVFQITSEPPTIAVSINKNNFTHGYINESKVFTASVLSITTPLPFIGGFGFRSGRDVDKLIGINYRLGKTGAPVILDNTVAYIEANVIKQLDVGTHTIFVGEIADAEIINDKEIMTYANYHLVRRGVTPVTAPTYIAEPKETKTE
ncbi:MAG TPA: flavin reductase family protein [Dehalococcoidia bacterium]